MRIKIEVDGEFIDASDIASYAKSVDANPATFGTWIEKCNKDDSATAVEPVARIGNSNFYAVTDLKWVAEKHATSPKTLRAMGYVHPDKHKAVEDHRDELAVRLAQIEEKYNQLRATFDDYVNGVHAE